MNPRLLAVTFFAASLGSLAAQEQGLEGDSLQKALADKAADFWVYDDLAAATKLARASGKPLLVSFRCVP
jgi:cytochrome oxidase Cu insertion factor (SCO1/SenC/PrrC family)